MTAIQVRLLAFVVAGAIAAAAGALVNGWRWEAKLAAANQVHADALAEIDRATARNLQAHQEQQADLQRRLELTEQQHYQELSHAQENTDRLRADLAADRQRLLVKVRGPASCSGVPAAPGAAGVDDGTQYAELHPATAADLAALAGDADRCAVRLKGLQAWAKELRAGSASR
ncbi:lysis system i-spanin subunit Rz [Pseudomonas sp. zfem005]|uniref:lysis system i-spanin subunit Rz n=1 Tax=Pseudomonas sp. zfem005 TaxID=3078200 RepID=UPI00292961D6|nr:lysis system i-spanin subunit Rz [Pseudomonas sp. zfem005]MDU9413826.1 lysis system i-spanin subunit Rz [Pseudomonas sp. zfem005]